MRFKNFKITDLDIFVAIGESKKRQYILTTNLQGKITGFRMFLKEKNKGYFLIYGDE